MTTETAIIPIEKAYTDTDLLELLADKRQTARDTADAIGRLEYEVIRRAQERRGTAIITDLYTAELIPTVTYDQSRLTPLLEALPEEGV